MLYVMLMASLAFESSQSNQSKPSIDWEQTNYFNKFGKIKKQVLILYPNKQYSYYQIGVNNKLHFDTGTYQYKSFAHKLQFNSVQSQSSFNPMTQQPIKVNGDEVYLSKDKTSFKSSNLSDITSVLSMFSSLKQIEIKNKPLDRVSLKRGYQLENSTDLSPYKQSIKTPESNALVYQKGQHIADSLYAIELKKAKDKSNQAVYDLARQLTKQASTDSAKLRLLCDWMTLNFEYDLEGPVNPSELIKVKATRCEGYANFILALCKELNIPNIKVIGTADNGSLKRYSFNEQSGRHAWNLVKIQGVWRPLDVTWLDPVWPKDYKKDNRVYGNEHYFNPDLEQLSLTHMPDIAALALTNFSSLGQKAFCENPVIEQKGYAIQYVGSNSNRIKTQNPSIQFEFYAAEDMDVTISRGKHESSYAIRLKSGINTILMPTPAMLSEYTFECGGLKAQFYINPSKGNLSALNAALKEVKAYNWAYQIEFYEYMIKLIQTKNIQVKYTNDSNGQITSMAKNIIETYDGLCPVGTWYLKWDAKKADDSPVFMRYYFTDQRIHGKRLFVECKVDCKFSDTKMLNPKKFTCSNWGLGLDY